MPRLRVDLLDHLTVIELDLGSRLLKEDLVHAITAPTAGRWKGLAILAYLTAKHTDPTAKLAPYTAMQADELVAELARLAGADAAADELEEAEAELARLEAEAHADPDAAAQAAIEGRGNSEGPNRSVSGDENSGEAAENPTGPTSGSSSPGPGELIPARSPV